MSDRKADTDTGKHQSQDDELDRQLARYMQHRQAKRLLQENKPETTDGLSAQDSLSIPEEHRPDEMPQQALLWEKLALLELAVEITGFLSIGALEADTEFSSNLPASISLTEDPDSLITLFEQYQAKMVEAVKLAVSAKTVQYQNQANVSLLKHHLSALKSRQEQQIEKQLAAADNCRNYQEARAAVCQNVKGLDIIIQDLAFLLYHLNILKRQGSGAASAPGPDHP